MLRIRPLLVGTATLALLLAACSGGDSNGGSDDDAGTTDGTDSGPVGTKDAGGNNGKDAGNVNNKDAGPSGCSPNCGAGAACKADTDCTSKACGVDGKCATGATDGKKDNGESDIDCGGSTTDMASKCALGKTCVNNTDCLNGNCGPGKTCSTPGAADGMQDFGESDIDCGGHSMDGAPLCADGSACADGTDCLGGFCSAGKKCVTPTSNDGIQNGTETDIDCGGGAPTNAPACPPGKKCVVGADCTVGGCNYKGICPTAISCTGQYGGDTCGPSAAPEDCCATLPAAGLPNPVTINGHSVNTATIDKYNITAGRMRAFVVATNGDMRTWIMNHKPVWWDDNWTNWLPTELDDGGANPACCGAVVSGDNVCTTAGNIGQACGVYGEFGPNVHGTGSVGANEGCVIRNYGARSYKLPDAVNANMLDLQVYSFAESDQRSMQCVTSYIEAAFCAWDGGHLPTTTQEDYLWHGGTYPWEGAFAGGACASNANCSGGMVCSGSKCTPPAYAGNVPPPTVSGAPAGYVFGNDTDPQNGKRGTQPTYGTIAYGQYSIGGGGQPTGGVGGVPGTVTAVQLTDLQWANYDANYWGGLSQTHVGFCASTNKYCKEGDACAGGPGGKCNATAADQTLFIAPPGRFPNGNGFYGHADLGGNVFNALNMASGANGNTQWSLSGSWQGHPIPWPGGRVNVPSYYKYWAMGARCAH